MKKRSKMKKLFAFFLMFLMLLSTVCIKTQTVEAAAKAKKVSLKSAAGSVSIGKTTKIKVKNAAKGTRIKYKSNKKSVAKVSKKGIVTGVKAGTAKIAVTVKKGSFSKKLTYKVTVKKPALSASRMSVGVGRSVALSVRNAPAKAKYKWSSSNSNIVSVNNGTVTGKRVGSAVVKVKVTVRKKVSYTLSCMVSVTAIPKKTYTVKFYSNGGSSVPSQVVESGQKATKPQNPIKSGYTFVGWYTNSRLTSAYDFNTPVTRNLSLYAKWAVEIPSEFTVKFETNGGNAIADQIVKRGNAVEKPADPVRDGYVFEGWYADEQLNQFYNFNDPVSKNLTLYARWTDMSKHSVTFVLNDGSMGAYEMQVVKHEEAASSPETDPERANYRFTGWYTDENAVEKYDFSSEVKGDLTLYAGWGSPDEDSEGAYNAASNLETVYSVTDLTVMEGEVQATVNVNSSSILVVSFLDKAGFFDDESWELENANVYDRVSIQTPEHCELTNITIPADTDELPEEYLVCAVLYDGDGEAVCEPYLCIDYTREYAQFQEKSVDDAEFAEKEVINFDNDPNNNFGVLAENIIEITSDGTSNLLSVSDPSESEKEEGMTVVETDEDITGDLGDITEEYQRVYTFRNPDQTVENLQPGDKILFSSAESIQQYLIKIETVEKDADGSVLVTEASDTMLTDFYQFLKVDADGSKEAKAGQENTAASRIDLIDIDETFKYSIGNKIEYKPMEDFKISVALNGGGSVRIKMAYDIHLFKENYFECSVVSSAEVKAEIKAELSVSDKKELKTELKAPKIAIPTNIPGLEIYSAITVPVSAEISGGAALTISTKAEQGFTYNTNSGRQNVDKRETTVNLHFTGKAEVSAGPKITLGVGLLNEVLTAEVAAQAGVKVTVSEDTDIGHVTTAESIHACTLCLKGEAKWFAKVTAKLKYKLSDKLSGDAFAAELLNFEGWMNPFGICPGKFHLSLINDQDSLYQGNPHFEFAECTNKKYKTVVEVCDADGNICSGNPIIIRKQNGGQADTGMATHTFYLYNGIYLAGSSIDDRSVNKAFVVNKAAQTVRLKAEASKGIVRGKVCDAETGDPVGGAIIQFIQEDMKIATYSSQEDGSFSTLLPDGSYRIEISKSGYIPITTYDTFENSGTKYMETFRMAPDDQIGRGGFAGQITDAVTGDPVSDVTLQLRSGWNAPEEHEVIQTLTTDSNGEFLYDITELYGTIWGLPSGAYSLTASKEDYATMQFNVMVHPNEVTENQDATISPALAEDEYRIILRWGATPSDLDSHYNAITTDGWWEHVYYSDMDGQTASLDWDARSSYGPETITVTGFDQLKNGFIYSVHDYSNEGYDYCTELSSSGAYVTLLRGNKRLKTYYVPTGRDGTVWNVFSIDKYGTITDLNTFGYAYDDEVGSDYIDATVYGKNMDLFSRRKLVSDIKEKKHK